MRRFSSTRAEPAHGQRHLRQRAPEGFAADERPISHETVSSVLPRLRLAASRRAGDGACPARSRGGARTSSSFNGSLDEPSRSRTPPRQRAERSAQRPTPDPKAERMSRALAALADIPSPATTSSAMSGRPVLRRKARRHRAAAQSTIEQYRKLAATLHHAQVEKQLKVVMVSSAVSGTARRLNRRTSP